MFHRLATALVIAVLTLSFSSAAMAQTWAGVPLHEVDNSDVSGQGTLTDNGDGTTTVHIEILGQLTAIMPSAIHAGTPDQYAPEPAFRLTDVVDGTSKTVIRASLADLLAGDYVIVVRQSKDAPERIVALGKIRSI